MQSIKEGDLVLCFNSTLYDPKAKCHIYKTYDNNKALCIVMCVSNKRYYLFCLQELMLCTVFRYERFDGGGNYYEPEIVCSV